jgi:ATP-binding cassette subfamily G (WHITE) protein 2 (PDR)
MISIRARCQAIYTNTVPSVLATPIALPGFWIFMYRLSPLSYLVSGMLSVGLANSHIVCSAEELLHISPPAFSDCSAYLASYIEERGGYLLPSTNSTDCIFCRASDTNVFLRGVSAIYSDRWRNFGICWVYIVFNIAAAIGFYWLARVPKGKTEK